MVTVAHTLITGIFLEYGASFFTRGLTGLLQCFFPGWQEQYLDCLEPWTNCFALCPKRRFLLLISPWIASLDRGDNISNLSIHVGINTLSIH